MQQDSSLAGLVIFLREIFAATQSVRIGMAHHLPHRDRRWSTITKD